MIWNQCTTLLVLVKEYKWGYAASRRRQPLDFKAWELSTFWWALMFFPDQLNKNIKDRSNMRTNIGGYKIDCHMIALPRRLRRPNARKSSSGEAFTNESTTPFWSPAGDIAGANATKTSTLSFKVGWMERAAKACAVPWEKPIYDSDCWDVVLRI